MPNKHTAAQSSTSLSDVEAARITISGHQMDLGEALQAKARSSIKHMASKYFDGIEEISAVFTKTKRGFTCAINMHADKGGNFQGKAEHENPYGALSGAVTHASKQARRRKREIREDKHRSPDKLARLN